MKNIKKLIVLAQDYEDQAVGQTGVPTGERSFYGGYEFSLPDTHKAGMIVPHGGSSCANCRFAEIRDDGPHCTSSYWISWNGGESKLPVDDPADYCSDFWEPKE